MWSVVKDSAKVPPQALRQVDGLSRNSENSWQTWAAQSWAAAGLWQTGQTISSGDNGRICSTGWRIWRNQKTGTLMSSHSPYAKGVEYSGASSKQSINHGFTNKTGSTVLEVARTLHCLCAAASKSTSWVKSINILCVNIHWMAKKFFLGYNWAWQVPNYSLNWNPRISNAFISTCQAESICKLFAKTSCMANWLLFRVIFALIFLNCSPR